MPVQRARSVPAIVASSFLFAATCFAPAAARAEPAILVEYFHPLWSHYFVTAIPAETDALDAGPTSSWQRTGRGFRVETAPGTGLAPVCRFHTAAFAGRGSHFYTADAAECDAVKANPDWTYEGIVFHAIVPDAAGQCAAGQVMVERYFNNGAGGAPNHVYTTDALHRLRLAGAGWVSEGAVFCIPPAHPDAVAQTQLLAGTEWELPDHYLKPQTAPIRIRFLSVPATGSLGGMFESLGMPALPAGVYHHALSGGVFEAYAGFGGFGGFDPLTGTWRIGGLANYEDWPMTSVGWELPSVAGPTVQACTFSADAHFADPSIGLLHPFQPYLRTPCIPVTAVKL